MMVQKTILRTHGGLGNQIFQVLFGRLFARKNNLDLIQIHDENYKHQFPKSEYLKCDANATNLQFLISGLRIPKLNSRIFGRPERPFRFFGDYYLDGYFQEKQYYQNLSGELVSQQLQIISDELKIEKAHKEKTLVHLRLGDFFENQSDAKAHVIQRLSNIPTGSDIITNDERLLADDNIQDAMCKRSISLIKTSEKSAEELLGLMSKYKYINSNGSTLTFWASVLSGSCVQFSNHDLVRCQEYLRRYRELQN